MVESSPQTKTVNVSLTIPHTRLDGLLTAMIIIAEVSGPMAITDFNDKTWQMLCEIQKRLANEAAKEAEIVNR